MIYLLTPPPLAPGETGLILSNIHRERARDQEPSSHVWVKLYIESFTKVPAIQGVMYCVGHWQV